MEGVSLSRLGDVAPKRRRSALTAIDCRTGALALESVVGRNETLELFHQFNTTWFLVRSLTAFRFPRWGAVVVLAGFALHGANLALAVALSGSQVSILIPTAVVVLGLIVVVSSLRIWFGRGPMVSVLYNKDYPKAFIRVLVIAAVANFLLVGHRKHSLSAGVGRRLRAKTSS